MKIVNRLLLLLVFTGTMVLFSCKKNTERDIVGKWERMIVETANPKEYEFWEFDGSKITITKQDTLYGSQPYVSDSGRYVIKSGLRKRVLRTVGFGNFWYNNLDWSIERLKDGQLVIFSDRDNNFFYLEFVRKY
jgi:hypothetical protein